MPVMLKPRVEKESEVDRVYRLIKAAIMQCEFAPGDFLVEVDLARQCETSRTPVREACTRLGHEGWISQIRYKGTWFQRFQCERSLSYMSTGRCSSASPRGKSPRLPRTSKSQILPR